MKYYFLLALSFLFVFYTSSAPVNQDIIFDTQNKTCDVCKDMVGLIDHELNLGNKTIGDITRIVDDICRIIGGPAGAECVFIVDNIQKIVDDLCKGMNATRVCETLKLC